MNIITNNIREVMLSTWPMIVLTCVVLISLRVAYLVKNKQKLNLQEDLIMLIFIIYILCLFQIVTSQDVSGEHGINITLFKELTRYEFGSRLFYRNIIGNIMLFIPFGFFTSYYLTVERKRFILFLTIIVSFVIEFIQLKIGRAFDVDDVILNVIGGLLGYWLYRIVNKLFGNLSKNIKGSLTLLLLLVGVVVATIILI